MEPPHGPGSVCPTSVAGIIAPLKMTATVDLVETFIAPSAGNVAVTTGPMQAWA